MKKNLLKVSILTASLLTLSLFGGCGSKAPEAQIPEVPSREVLWSYNTNAQINSSPVIYDNFIIFGNALQKIIALDKTTQKEAWSLSVDGVVTNNLLLDEDTLILSTYSSCYAINPKTGEEIWKYKGDGDKTEALLNGYDYHSPSPIVHKDTVIFPTVSGKIYFLDKATGNLKLEYKEEGTGDLRATPTILNDNMYVADIKGNVYGVDLTTQKSLWKVVNGSDVAYAITSSDDMVFITGRNTKVAALDAKTGSQKWIHSDKLGSWFTGEMTVVDGVLYVPGSDNEIVLALDSKTGNPVNNYITNGNVFSKPLVVNGMIYTTSGKVYEKDKGSFTAAKLDSKAEPLWRVELNTHSFSSPVISDGVIYFGGTDGKIFAVKAD
ncbi:MAG: PQQ-binding-like beta-propeller repeat protein [Clostridium sp.]